MDFQKFTTDDLLAALPAGHEDNRWEVKSADFLDPAKKGEFKSELGKQVSAFANSGGGNLIFGVSNSGSIEQCPTHVGKQTMKDYLATMVEQSVESPIRSFNVYSIPFTDDHRQSVFAIVIEDSQAAPHQAKVLRNYFYRIDGHSKPAPHFHVELLRNRITKAVLEITDVDYVFKGTSSTHHQEKLSVDLIVEVENQSFQAATSFGVHIQTAHEDKQWYGGPANIPLAFGFCVRGGDNGLLPHESTDIIIPVNACFGRGPRDCLQAWEQFVATLRPISQNNVGRDWKLGGSTDTAKQMADMCKFENEYNRWFKENQT